MVLHLPRVVDAEPIGELDLFERVLEQPVLARRRSTDAEAGARRRCRTSLGMPPACGGRVDHGIDSMRSSNERNSPGRLCCSRKREREAAALHEQVACQRDQATAGEQLGRQQRIVGEALAGTRRRSPSAPGRNAGVGQPLTWRARIRSSASGTPRTLSTNCRSAPPSRRSATGAAPSCAGIGSPPTLEVVGRCLRDGVGERRAARPRHRRPCPNGAGIRTGRSAMAAPPSRRAAGRGTCPRAARRCSGMAKATSRQRAVPTTAGGVLDVRESGAFEVGRRAPPCRCPWPGSGRSVRAVPGEQALGRPAAAGRSGPVRPSGRRPRRPASARWPATVPSSCAMPRTRTRVGIVGRRRNGRSCHDR